MRGTCSSHSLWRLSLHSTVFFWVISDSVHHVVQPGAASFPYAERVRVLTLISYLPGGWPGPKIRRQSDTGTLTGIYFVQFSTDSPAIRLNSRSLFVARVTPRAIAWAPIHRSLFPIGRVGLAAVSCCRDGFVAQNQELDALEGDGGVGASVVVAELYLEHTRSQLFNDRADLAADQSPGREIL